MEICREEEIGETVWLLLSNIKRKIKIRTIYTPQETVTQNTEYKRISHNISEQIIVGKADKQQVSFLRDFNAKFGNLTEGNKNAVTKGEDN